MKNVDFGDILTVENGIIVHGCNNRGVMGSGIAKQIRAKWPDAYHLYSTFIATGNYDTEGKVVFYNVPASRIIIANGITQNGYGNDGQKYVSYKAVAEVFVEVAIMAETCGHEVHYPMIGAGLGGGDWAIISDVIEGIMSNFPSVKHTLWINE
jgi:O-acetyl-ADP-ribose deacetylase (regulator of RNase III)